MGHQVLSLANLALSCLDNQLILFFSETRLIEVVENACGGGYGQLDLASMDMHKVTRGFTQLHHLLLLYL